MRGIWCGHVCFYKDSDGIIQRMETVLGVRGVVFVKVNQDLTVEETEDPVSFADWREWESEYESRNSVR